MLQRCDDRHKRRFGYRTWRWNATLLKSGDFDGRTA
jgi:hypothetical protein